MKIVTEIETAKRCPCGGTFMRYVWPNRAKNLWVCTSPGGPGKCNASGKTYDEALKSRSSQNLAAVEVQSSPRKPKYLIDPETLSRFNAMMATPIEAVADAGAIQLMAAAFQDCIKSLAAAKPDEDTKQVIGAAAKRFFMLGRLSALN
jgi:hypothetical protein